MRTFLEPRIVRSALLIEASNCTGEDYADDVTALRDIGLLISRKPYAFSLEELDTGGGVTNLLYAFQPDRDVCEGGGWPQWPVIVVLPDEAAYLFRCRTDYDEQREPVSTAYLYDEPCDPSHAVCGFCGKIGGTEQIGAACHDCGGRGMMEGASGPYIEGPFDLSPPPPPVHVFIAYTLCEDQFTPHPFAFATYDAAKAWVIAEIAKDMVENDYDRDEPNNPECWLLRNRNVYLTYGIISVMDGRVSL